MLSTLPTLQRIYRNVENWQPKKLIGGVYRRDENACAIGTDDLFSADATQWTNKWAGTFGYGGPIDDLMLEIQNTNDNFVGSNEARWEYMTKWLLNKIQNHPDYVKSEVDTNYLVVV